VKHVLSLALVLVLCASTLVLAQSPQPKSACEPLVDRALEVSGFNDSIRSLPAQVDEQLRQKIQNDNELSAAAKKKFAAMLQKNTAPQKIALSVKQNFLANCDPAMLEGALAQFQSATVQEMRKRESFAMSAAGRQQMQAYLATLESRPPAQSRLDLLERMDASLRVTDSMLEMVMNMSEAMATGFHQPWGTEAEVAQMKAQYRPTLHNAIIANELFTYREVSDQQLEAYVAMNEKGPMHDFCQRLSTYQQQALMEWSQNLGREIRKLIDQLAKSDKSAHEETD
jgi:hypothetical protein